jgi:hypothetical protein
MRTKIRMKMRLKLWENNKLVLDTTRRRKSQILLQLERVSHHRSYIMVTYPCGDHNDSFHDSDESLKVAMSAYLEKSLLDYLADESGQK